MIKIAVILAAGLGTRLRNVTQDLIPKPFFQIGGVSLIERSINNLNECGIKEIIIVTGHLDHFFENLKEKYSNIKTVKNHDFATTGSMMSFYTAKTLIAGQDILLLEGDLIYEKAAIKRLINSPLKNAILFSEDKYYGDDYYFELKDNIIGKMSNNRKDFDGNYAELTGISKISNKLYLDLCDHLQNINTPTIGYEYCIEALGKNTNIHYEKQEGLIWAEVDDQSQLDNVINNIYPSLIEKESKK